VEHVSAQCYESEVQTCKGLNRLRISDIYIYIYLFYAQIPMFQIFKVKRLWPRSRTI